MIPQVPIWRWRFAVQLPCVALTYYAVGKLGLDLATINPSATPVWPATGIALASFLLFGYRVWPAIFIAALAVNATTAGTLSTSLAIASGNTLEGLVGAWLINRRSDGVRTFDTPVGIFRFAVLCLAAATPVSATIGVTTLGVAGFAAWADYLPIWLTWWLGDIAGALVVTPALVLWATDLPKVRSSVRIGEEIGTYAMATLVGIVAYSPLSYPPLNSGPLAFLAIVPLLWSALRLGRREAATVSLIFSAFAVWGVAWTEGPFARATLNESFMLLLTFMIGMSVPILALSADVVIRKRAETGLRATLDDLDQRVRERTATLVDTNAALKEEIDRRRKLEGDLTRDIEARKRTQADLVESEQRFRMFVDGVADHAIYMLDPDGRITNWNSGAERIHGYTATEMLGQRFDRFYPPQMRDSGAPLEALATATELGRFEAEGWRVRKDGSQFWASVVINRLTDGDGNIVGFSKVTRDITERRRNQQALDEAREQLYQSQKMEALGRLVGGVAHDFNNLLAVMLSGLALIQRAGDDKDRVTFVVDETRKAVSRGERMTKQLLSFSRGHELQPTVVDLRERFTTMGDLIEHILGSNVRVSIMVEDGLNCAWIDPSQFEFALLNICLNARDAMPDGGTLTISARNESPSDSTTDIRRELVSISISDTGIGIPDRILPKIFEPFFTTKELGKGSGLGLSQAYGFVTQSGGTIEVESEVGVGTTLTLRLPASELAPDVVASGVTKGTVPDAMGNVVLMVEDDKSLAGFTSQLLEQSGYRVVVAETATEALEHLRAGGRFDIVFSDIVMPGGMSGVQFARLLRSDYPALPVLLATGFSDMVDAAKGEGIQIVTKPYDPDVVIATIANLISETKRNLAV